MNRKGDGLWREKHNTLCWEGTQEWFSICNEQSCISYRRGYCIGILEPITQELYPHLISIFGSPSPEILGGELTAEKRLSSQLCELMSSVDVLVMLRYSLHICPPFSFIIYIGYPISDI
jgi:hypothetical protein